MPNPSVGFLRHVVSVAVVGAYTLRLRFDDGVQGDVDVSREVPFRGVFGPLADPKAFANVRVDPELGTVVWPGGADLDPLVLYERVVAGAAAAG